MFTWVDGMGSLHAQRLVSNTESKIHFTGYFKCLPAVTVKLWALGSDAFTGMKPISTVAAASVSTE